MHNLANDQIMISCSTVTCGIKLALHDLYIYFVQAKVEALHAASEVQFDGEEQLSSLYILL